MAKDLLQEWINDKPPIIAGFSVAVAMGAEPCHELITTAGSRSQLWLPYRKLRRGPWLEYYADDVHVCRGVMEGLGWQDDVVQWMLFLAQSASWSRTNGESEALRAALSEVTPEGWVKFRNRAMRWRAKLQRWKREDLLIELDSDDAGLLINTNWSDFWHSSAGQFFMRVAVPCYVLHGRWPARAVRDATNRRRPNLKLLCSLVTLDHRLMEVPRVERLLYGSKSPAQQGRRSRVGKALAATPKRISLKAVKCRLGRLIIELADRLGVRLDAGDIRSLFDAVAIRERGSLRDSDLPDTPWALTKGIQRNGGVWDLPERWTYKRPNLSMR